MYHWMVSSQAPPCPSALLILLGARWKSACHLLNYRASQTLGSARSGTEPLRPHSHLVCYGNYSTCLKENEYVDYFYLEKHLQTSVYFPQLELSVCL